MHHSPICVLDFDAVFAMDRAAGENLFADQVGRHGPRFRFGFGEAWKIASLVVERRFAVVNVEIKSLDRKSVV